MRAGPAPRSRGDEALGRVERAVPAGIVVDRTWSRTRVISLSTTWSITRLPCGWATPRRDAASWSRHARSILPTNARLALPADLLSAARQVGSPPSAADRPGPFAPEHERRRWPTRRSARKAGMFICAPQPHASRAVDRIVPRTSERQSPRSARRCACVVVASGASRGRRHAVGLWTGIGSTSTL
jgi:hypothetical protein